MVALRFFILNFYIMARFLLGSIVTDIQGSIGGTTFRRTPTGHIAYNKQARQLRSSSSAYSRKIQLGKIFQAWSNLTQNERNAWAEKAVLFPFPDKFGKSKFLTGRQLFIKLNSQLTVKGSSVLDPSLLDSTLNFSAINSMSIDIGANTCDIDFDTNVSSGTIVVSFYKLRKGSKVKPHAHFRASGNISATGTNTYDFWTQLNQRYPNLKPGEIIGVNAYLLNDSGFKSAVASALAVVEMN